MQRTELNEVHGGAAVAETAKPKPKAVKETKGKGGKKPVKETGKRAKKVKEKSSTATVDRPAGTLPGPEGDGIPLWELPPEELRARLDSELWPSTATGAPGAWVPKPPMTLSDYLENGA